MWIKRFFDNTNDAIEKEDRLILTRRSFFFLSAAAAGAAIVAPTIMKPLTATVSEYDDFISLSLRSDYYSRKSLELLREAFCIQVGVATANAENGQIHLSGTG